MKIEYYHASRFGNGAKVAEEFRRQAGLLGATVDVQHIRDANPRNLPTADLYVFSSPGQWGKPIRKVRRFLGELDLPAGTKCAVLTTELAPRPDKQTGVLPTEEEQAKWQKVRPIINELLENAGLTRVAEDKILVTEIRGPLQDGWEAKVLSFAEQVVTPTVGVQTR